MCVNELGYMNRLSDFQFGEVFVGFFTPMDDCRFQVEARIEKCSSFSKITAMECLTITGIPL